ncbi:hypothetical protein BH09PAT1_BH09PAT1_3240 [soil metagenome]
MGRVKGIKNKNSTLRLTTSSLSTHQRISFLANLIIDKIQEDRRNGNQLCNKVRTT